MSKNHVDIVKSETLERGFRTLDDATNMHVESMDLNRATENFTYCLRERPMSFGPLRVPKKILVVMMRSERRKLSSLITRPLGTVRQFGYDRRYRIQNIHLNLRVSGRVALGGIEPNEPSR